MWVKPFSLEHVPGAVLFHHWDGASYSWTWRDERCNHCLQPSQNLFVPLNNKLLFLVATVFIAWALPPASFSNWDQALWASWGFLKFLFWLNFLIFFFLQAQFELLQGEHLSPAWLSQQWRAGPCFVPETPWLLSRASAHPSLLEPFHGALDVGMFILAQFLPIGASLS